MSFDAKDFLPATLLAKVTDVRVTDPERSLRAARFLDDKLLIVSFNRGGLLGSSWEIDDTVSGPTAESCKQWGIDGAKILLRLCDSEPDSRKTLLATVRAITELNAVGLPMFLESLPVVKEDDGGIIHHGWTIEHALDNQAAHRGRDADWLSHIV